MELPAWVFIIENIVFWSIVVYIAFQQQATPSWVFGILLLFVIWFGIRLLLTLGKMDRLFAINIMNQVIILLLFYRLSKQRQ
jgi:hypothetical protein